LTTILIPFHSESLNMVSGISIIFCQWNVNVKLKMGWLGCQSDGKFCAHRVGNCTSWPACLVKVFLLATLI
jgi:hypothetical protein